MEKGIEVPAKFDFDKDYDMNLQQLKELFIKIIQEWLYFNL